MLYDLEFFKKKIQHCLLFCSEILCRRGIMLYFFAVFIEICNINQFQSGQSGDNLDLRLAARCCCLIFRLHQKKPTTGVEQCRIYPECWLFAVYRENEITRNRKTVTYFILTWTKSQHRQVSTRKIGPHQRKCWLFMPYIENQPTQLFLRGMTAFYAHHNAPILCVHNKTGDVNDIPGPLVRDEGLEPPRSPARS